MRSIFDCTRVQFLGAALIIWAALVVLYALIYFSSNMFFGTGDGRWDKYGLIVAILSLPYAIAILLVNIFCVFRGEEGCD